MRVFCQVEYKRKCINEINKFLNDFNNTFSKREKIMLLSNYYMNIVMNNNYINFFNSEEKFKNSLLKSFYNLKIQFEEDEELVKEFYEFPHLLQLTENYFINVLGCIKE